MELVLTLEGGGAGAAGEAQRRVRGGRFSIGRAADNDWVLPDPERVLSKHHCLIEERGGEWLVTDTSSNVTPAGTVGVSTSFRSSTTHSFGLVIVTM